MPGAPGELGSFDGAGWAGRGGAHSLSRVRGDPAESGVKLTLLCAARTGCSLHNKNASCLFKREGSIAGHNNRNQFCSVRV